MGKLARLVDGIKEKLGGAGGGNNATAAAACYDKVDKTDSMRVEIRSRRAQELMAKNLAAADSIAGSSSPRGGGGCVGRGGKKKKRFLAF